MTTQGPADSGLNRLSKLAIDGAFRIHLPEGLRSLIERAHQLFLRAPRDFDASSLAKITNAIAKLGLCDSRSISLLQLLVEESVHRHFRGFTMDGLCMTIHGLARSGLTPPEAFLDAFTATCSAMLQVQESTLAQIYMIINNLAKLRLKPRLDFLEALVRGWEARDEVDTGGIPSHKLLRLLSDLAALKHRPSAALLRGIQSRFLAKGFSAKPAELLSLLSTFADQGYQSDPAFLSLVESRCQEKNFHGFDAAALAELVGRLLARGHAPEKAFFDALWRAVKAVELRGPDSIHVLRLLYGCAMEPHVRSPPADIISRLLDACVTREFEGFTYSLGMMMTMLHKSRHKAGPDFLEAFVKACGNLPAQHFTAQGLIHTLSVLASSEYEPPTAFVRRLLARLEEDPGFRSRSADDLMLIPRALGKLKTTPGRTFGQALVAAYKAQGLESFDPEALRHLVSCLSGTNFDPGADFVNGVASACVARGLGNIPPPVLAGIISHLSKFFHPLGGAMEEALGGLVVAEPDYLESFKVSALAAVVRALAKVGCCVEPPGRAFVEAVARHFGEKGMEELTPPDRAAVTKSFADLRCSLGPL
jgi:hypothetical protein